jgi:hypothetical protein
MGMMEEDLVWIGNNTMASRIVFLPISGAGNELFQEKLVTFDWVPGIAISQAKKSIRNLHEAAVKQIGVAKVLEISTRSEVIIGISLSAFNLQFEKNNYSVESAYQASKVFEKGGPYLDLLNSSSTDAKTDVRLKNSGLLTGFRFEGEDFPITFAPNFYDYLYIRSLLTFKDRFLLKGYDCFTDIAFSQTSLVYKNKRAFNCQARSAAIYSTLISRYSEVDILTRLRELMGKHSVEASQLDLF